MDEKNLESREREAKINDSLASLHRKIDRRGFIYKLAGSIAGLLAFALIRPANGLGEIERAFAYPPGCDPPGETECSGCRSSGCPSGFEICTTHNDRCPQKQCIYPIGWWYSRDSKYKCYDCQQVLIGPPSCQAGYSNGGFQCGCAIAV